MTLRMPMTCVWAKSRTRLPQGNRVRDCTEVISNLKRQQPDRQSVFPDARPEPLVVAEYLCHPTSREAREVYDLP
ncbi:hypothetical protein EMIT0P395_170030 [Pseudomonas sp. IT-P395]